MWRVADAHCDTISKRLMGQRQSTLDLKEWFDGGVVLQVFACFIEPQFKPELSLKRCLQQIDAFERLVVGAGATPVLGREDVLRILRGEERRLGALLAVEGGEAISGDLAVLRALYRLGVRLITLTWNQRNDIAEGVGDDRAGGGLSSFGAEVVHEMNRLGMAIDVSHLSEAGFWDVLEISKAPIIASHSSCRALSDHTRNLDDDQLKALGKAGGYVGINFYPAFLSKEEEEVGVRAVVDHLEHAAEVAGFAAVGLGSDFDGIERTPIGLEAPSRMQCIGEELARRGWSEENIRMVMGENLLAYLSRVLN